MTISPTFGNFEVTKKNPEFDSKTGEFLAELDKLDHPITEADILAHYNLDPKDWMVIDLGFGSDWQREAEGADAVTKLAYRGKVKLRNPVEAAQDDDTGAGLLGLRPSRPFKVKVPKAKTFNIANKWETIAVIPDQQFGYRSENKKLVPVHDEDAIKVSHDIMIANNVSGAVNLGDLLDNEPFSRYADDPAFTATTQEAIDRGHEDLAIQREIVKDGPLVYLKGNHDKRINDYITQHARAALGLRKADEPDGWPALSVQNLLSLDSLDVIYIDNYPDGEWWLDTNTLRFIHGKQVNTSGSTAASLSKQGSFSTICGHIHRIELHYHTARVNGGGTAVVFGHSPGTLARIDGPVPGYASDNNVKGEAMTTYADWQQAMSLVHYIPGRAYSEQLEVIPIHNGQALHRGIEWDGRDAR